MLAAMRRRSPPRPGSRARLATALVFYVSLAATALWCFIVWGAIGLGTCGGDGGAPHAQPGSLAQRFCDGFFDNLWPLLGVLPVAAVAAHLVGLGCLLAGRSWRTAICWLVSAYLVVALYSVPVILPRS
jgi:hypothetical protein